MAKFNIGDKVKLEYPNNIFYFDGYVDAWQEFWYDNKNTIFTINSITNNRYQLKYINDEIVINPMNDVIKTAGIFREYELELYTNPLPDDLFEL